MPAAVRSRWLLLVGLSCGCTASGSDNQTHGPVFLDSGVDATADAPSAPDAPPDGASDTGLDAPVDAGSDVPTDVGADVPAGDAGDGGADTGTDAGTDGGSCAGTVAIVGGSATAGFGAVSKNGGAYSVSTLTPAAFASAPSIAAFAGGFVAVFEATGTALQYAAWGSSWSAPANVAAALTRDVPALAVVGSSLHAVYLGTDDKFYHGVYGSLDGGAPAWDGANDPVPQAMGTSAAAAASVGTTLIMAQSGSNMTLYDQSWSGTWATADAHAGTTTTPTIAPAMTALTGGSADLLLVYENNATNVIYATARTAGTWSTPVATNTLAFTNKPPSLAALPAGKAVLVFLGTDNNPYFMLYDPAQATPWSTPERLVTGNQSLPSAPSVATGGCGAEATAVYVQPGEVDVVELHGATWSSPAAVGGTAGTTYVAVATGP